MQKREERNAAVVSRAVVHQDMEDKVVPLMVRKRAGKEALL
jgi:hypothetical protein